MTPKGTQPSLTPPETPASEAAGRRPYVKPVLRHLGSVRELTLGATSGPSEGFGTFFQAM